MLKKGPLFHNETDLSDLHRHPFCSTDAPHSLINVVKEQCPKYEFHPHITFLGRNSADMLRAIRSGSYVGLVVKRNMPDDPDLRILPVLDFDISLPCEAGLWSFIVY